MKELKQERAHIEKYDVNVNTYLTPTQIEAIALEVVKQPSWIEREQIICYYTLKYATDIKSKVLDDLDPEMIVASGLWLEVMCMIRNFGDIQQAVNFYESPVRLLADIAQNTPELLEQLRGIDIKGVMNNANIQ